MALNSDTAFVLVNYGTPRSCNVGDVRKYLKQLLNNRHVITMNSVGRWLLVNAIIAPMRATKSAALYARLQDKRGMPLLYHTQDLVEKLKNYIGNHADVFFAMTAGTHLLKDVCNDILKAGYSKLLIMPMYPQYTESTVVNVIDEVFSIMRHKRCIPYISFVPEFYNNQYYIDSMRQLLLNNLSNFDYDMIVFSYHGIPLSHNNIKQPSYQEQCVETTRLICKASSIPMSKVETSFQSRMNNNWVQPFTDNIVIQAAKNGVKNLAVITPSFTVDCLETVVEISQNLKQIFLNNGGQQFCFVPCLNAQDYWAKAIAQMVSHHLF